MSTVNSRMQALRRKPWLTVLLAVASSVVTAAAAAGCVAVAAGAVVGAGAYAYHAGRLNSSLDAPLDRSYDAALAAVRDMEWTQVSTAKDTLDAKIVARTAEDKEVTVRLKRVTDEATDISIRIGGFGDERASTALLARIRGHL